MSNNHIDVEDKEPVEAVFYDVDKADNYSEVGELEVEVHENDVDYPLSVTGQTEDGREIGLILDHKLIKRIVAEAWVLGII